MASYNRIKATKIAPIGTIMPWCGGSRSGDSPDNVPTGWIVCNSSSRGLYAADYPILARIIKNTYGPVPETPSEQIGVNLGIVNDFPYNPPDTDPNHDPTKFVDTFDLPNLNQIALIDIEASRIDTEDLFVIGQYLSENGSDEGSQSPTLKNSDVDLIFDVEPSNNLAGRITGITMDDPIYFDTVYVYPRKLGVDHTPQHGHRPASTNEFDQFTSVFATGTNVLEFQPGTALQNDLQQTTSVTPIGNRGVNSFAHTFRPGTAEITWYDPNDGGISLVLGDTRQVISTGLNLVPQVQQRNIPVSFKIENGYVDDGSAISNIQRDAHTGTFPPAGRYSGRRNFYASPDIPDYHRGVNMPETYVNDPIYDPSVQSQPINTNVTNTYTTTLNHDNEPWASIGLRSHAHDSMEITMNRGSLGIPTTLLVNDVSTGTTTPVSVDTALNVTLNPNTPSLTIMYIMRAF